MLSKQTRASKTRPTQSRVGDQDEQLQLNCGSHTVLQSQAGRDKGHQVYSRASRQLALNLRYSYVLSWTFINLELFSGKRKVARFIVLVSQIRKLIHAW